MRKRRAIVCLLLLATAALAGLAWVARVELVLVPLAWREVREIRVSSPSGDDGSSPALGEAVERLLSLQIPELEGLRAVRFHELRTPRGTLEIVSWVQGESIDPLLVLVDPWGRVLGEPFRFHGGWTAGCFGPGTSVTISDGPGDVFSGILGETDLRLELGGDEGGIFPRGFFLSRRGGKENDELPQVSFAMSSVVDHWVREEVEYGINPLRAGEISMDSRPGDLFRALYAIEKLGVGNARLALPLLEHPDAVVRARAAAIVGNSPAHDAHVARLLQDPSSGVRSTARLVLLDAEERELAEEAFAGILREPAPPVFTRIHLDLAGLASPGVAEALVSWLEAHPEAMEGEASLPRAIETSLAALRKADVHALVPRLIELFEDREVRPLYQSLLGRLLVRADHPDAVQALVTYLGDPARGLGDTYWIGSSYHVLDELAAKDSALRKPWRAAIRELLVPHEIGLEVEGEFAFTAHVSLSGLLRDPNAGLAAVSVLLLWEDPGAPALLRELLKVHGPESVTHRFAPPQQIPEDLDGQRVVFDDPEWLAATHPQRARTAFTAALVDIAVEDPETYGPAALRFVGSLWGAGIPWERGVDGLWDRILDYPEELAQTLRALIDLPGAAGDDRTRRLVRRTLSGSRSDSRVGRLLVALLSGPCRSLLDDRARARLEELAAARDPPDLATEFGRSGWRERIWEDRELIHLFAKTDPGAAAALRSPDVALAASLLLVRLEMPGSKEAFLARLREPGNTWLFDWLTGAFLRPRLADDLRELAKEKPERYGERVRDLLEVTSPRPR